ncbi:tudor and KH domain-containing protein homolog [Uranotaenia lowii]|uniref:tudor and KH domain-containing protein homolog n=1 Tax=Uranotaenia lowii TaxID=190385 RepID=UPI0024797FD1|nr:tudor and KH domain-containing protein homolog [Uranotaenia lowii]XP_055598802.1 tudor and KH domain-containing protein homolog [Uranotaenia lowii]XP_055598803.1 tudor and KH domain-containing protein homolog [Uranotaenia lowii]XP_055598804.1 tudor and KH domain-containing protein homolog [Uranotaenia lowii]
MLKSTASMPIILGLSLLSVGSACVYAYIRKKKDEFPPETPDSIESEYEETGPISNIRNKLVRMLSKPEEEVKTIEVTLSNSVVPLVVGRKGATLKYIQEKSKTSIRFRELDGSHQICEIRGTDAGIREADELIMKEASRQVTITEEVLVPMTACNKIIGRCGDALQEICRKSLAKVWIEGSAAIYDNRRIMITGTQSQINVAKSLIEEKVKADAELRKTQADLEIKREPRIRSPPTSLAITPVVREIRPNIEKLKSTNSSGQLEVFVSAVVSPSRFYLQLVGPQSAELDKLVETMTDYYNQEDNRDSHKIRKPYLGQIVAALLNADNKWYRAEVVAIQPNEFITGQVVLDLYFVDYGDNQFVQPSEVYELRPDFLALRFQAIECFLAHVEPNTVVTSTTNIGADDWERAAVTRFEELTYVAQWRKLLSRTVTYKNKGLRGSREGREGSPVPGVELYDTTQPGADIDIAIELVNEGYARVTPNFGDLTRSHVLRLDGGFRSSNEKLNDTSKASSTGSLTPILSSRKILQEKAQDEPSSTTSPDKISSTNASAYFGGSLVEAKGVQNAKLAGVSSSTSDFIESQKEATNGKSAETNHSNKGFFTRDWNELVEEEEGKKNSLIS